jgi:beta-xylosidase
MLKKDGLYYFMWSSGDWTNNSYHVSYAVSSTPTGPFERKATILEAQEPTAVGPGHHGYLHLEDIDEWLIVYHRRIIGELDPGSRILCIDKLEIGDGEIKKVVMTNEW